MTRRIVLAAALALVLLPAGAARAQEGAGAIFECADFTPESVRAACDRAVPSACRGIPLEDSGGFEACLERNGTSRAAVDRALEAAQRAAGIPIGAVDAGLGGLAAPRRERDAPWWMALGATLAACGAAAALAARPRRDPAV